MLFAKVVVGLPIDVAFDYSVPHELQNNISIGSRVWVNLRNKKTVGYVVGFVPKSSIKNVKDILELIDNSPLLGKNELLLTKQISNYYCCSWGEAIETALPEGIRKGKTVSLDRDSSIATPLAPISKKETVLLHNLEPEAKWNIYVKEIQLALDKKKSAIILFGDIQASQKAKEIVDKKIGVSTEILYRKELKELDTWVRIRSCETSVVIGTRSAVFAPVNNLGLIIVDSEEDSVYKQEQVPHYHAREVALMRSDIEKVKVILESRSPTLESFYLAKQGKISYQLIPRLKAAPEIKIIDTRRLSFSERKSKPMLSKFLADTVYSVLNEKGKALLFLNRKGFATYASCHNCGVALRCPRCNIALAYHFQENSLICHHCNFKMEAPEICPTCNSGYIKYSGIGTDKVESELSRIFPQARIKKIESQESAGLNDADIFVATSAVLKNENLNFDLIGILNIDNSLNRVDFRAAEKAFSLLMGLVSLTNKKIIIQTSFPEQHAFEALLKMNPGIFYLKELKTRKQLGFPPYKHLALVKLRAKNLDKVKKAAQDLFEKIKKATPKGVKVISLSPAQPEKLRGNFYWQILLSATDQKKLSVFLKRNLKESRYSGIIVTVDIDPV